MNKKSLEKDMTVEFYMTMIGSVLMIGSIIAAIVALLCGSALCIVFGLFVPFWLMEVNDSRNELKELLAEYGQLENEEV